MAAEGADLDGEARLVDALVAADARILDAGCGPGRVGAALFRRGHQVLGVDVDPLLIDAASQDYPGPTWLVADLAELDLAAMGHPEAFDGAVLAGNVMAFLAPGTGARVLGRIAVHLRPEAAPEYLNILKHSFSFRSPAIESPLSPPRGQDSYRRHCEYLPPSYLATVVRLGSCRER